MDSSAESLVDFSVVSMARGAGLPQFRPHSVGNVQVIGVNHGEPIAVYVRNVSDELIGVRVIVDGINVSNGMRATHEPTDPMIYIRPQGLERIERWPSNYRKGETLVFREDATDPVKLFASDDIEAANTICAMIFNEGRTQQAKERSKATVVGAKLPGGGVVRKQQRTRRRQAQRLVDPHFCELIQYGYSWSDSLQQALAESSGSNGSGGKSSFQRFL